MIATSLLAIAAVIVVIISALAATGRLRRNPIAGIRIPSLYASDAAWRIGHRTALLPTGAAAAVCIVLAIAVLIDRHLAVVGDILETAALGIGLIAGTALASRAARSHSH